MPCKRAELAPGAYLHPVDGGGLFRVQAIRVGKTGVSEVALSDESVPLDTERVGAVGEPASYRVAEPEPELVPTHTVLRCFEVVIPAPSAEDIASVEEWGAAG